MGHAERPEKDELVVNVHEAKTHFSKLLRRVQGGQAVVIAKAGKPIARVVPLGEAAPSSRVFGAFKGWIECTPGAFDPSSDEADLFEGEGLLPK